MEGDSPVRVTQLMREIEEDVRRDRRKQLLAHGGPHEYEDSEVYATVDGILRRAVDGLDRPASLLPEVLDDESKWRLELPLRFSSHRPVGGQLLLFIKRRMLLPVFRWLYEYSLENFRRQQYVNRLLFACVEELAIENARLRKMLARQTSQGGVAGSGPPAQRS